MENQIRTHANLNETMREIAEENFEISKNFRSIRGAPISALHTFSDLSKNPAFSVYTAKNRQTLPGKLVRNSDTPSTDIAVNEAYDGAKKTYLLYKNEFDLNSIDGEGHDLTSTVHFGRQYDNAFWDGTQMVYGDGDGEIFNRFTIDSDVIGHEITHGVTQYHSNLVYKKQPGALNEHLSDVFGVIVKYYQEEGNPEPLIGANLIRKIGCREFALRNMKNPGTAYVDHPVLGTDPQPASMDAFVVTNEDQGGVHINSGIPNRAFWLFFEAVGGKIWDKPAKVWFRAAQKISSVANFKQFADATVAAAKELYPEDPSIEKAVREAWMTVKVAIS
jgi:Zn-dependent metalloprotease